MKKADLVSSLLTYHRHTRPSQTGEEAMVQFLAHYFDQLVIPADDEYDFWQIDSHVPHLLVGACEAFRTSPDETISRMRADYEQEVRHPFPDLTALTFGGGIEEALTARMISRVVADATGSRHLETQIEAIFFAEWTAVMKAFYRFITLVYRRGLYTRIDSCPARGMSGTFGATTLRSYSMAGRLMLTFARPGADYEHSLTFMCEDEDPLALGCGLQSVYANLSTALAMIDEVINGWPADPADQFEAFWENQDISIG